MGKGEELEERRIRKIEKRVNEPQKKTKTKQKKKKKRKWKVDKTKMSKEMTWRRRRLEKNRTEDSGGRSVRT